VPLISHCPVVMGLHEPAWWAWPEHYEWFDRNYMKAMLPLYIRKARHLFPISQFIVDECKKYIDHPFDHVTVAYPAPKPCFVSDLAPRQLADMRRKFDLPERFLFSVTRVDHPGLDGSDSFFPGKNVETTVRAFMAIRAEIPHELVIAGRRVKEFLLHVGLQEHELERIRFLDFIPHEELPAIYGLADVFVLPSFYESYAMALVEAMSCGCAVVASQTGACPEISGGAALLADPYDPGDFAAKIKQVLSDDALRAQLRAKSLERAKAFSWERTARATIEQIVRVVGAGSGDADGEERG
jgi:glycosyltransferase involved in cell wall biosynthesis